MSPTPAADMPAQILAGLRVLDLSHGIPGPMAALQLSEAGADVVKVTIPGEARDEDAPDILAAVLDRFKQRIVLDGAADGIDDTLDRLLAEADVLIHDLPPAVARRRGLDDARLFARYPRLIVSAVTGWPATHAKAEAPARETLVLAALGILDEQPGHRPGPVFVRMPFASWTAGWLAAIAVVARLIARTRDGHGGAAHTSLAQAALVPMTMHWSRAETPSPAFAKGLSKDIPIPLHQASDGRWIHVHYSPDKAPWMADALAAMGPDAVRRENARFAPSHVAPNYGANKAIIAGRPAADWVAHFWAHDVAAQIAAPFGEIYADPQAAANGFVATVEDPVLGATLQPGVPFTVAPASRIRHSTAGLETDADAILRRWTPRAAVAVPAATAPRAPLDGLKVLDLGAYLAGPFATMLLADLGADVIKVEPPTGDAMRRLERQFAGIQRGKRGLAMMLGRPETGAATAALARWADVVHHNIRRPAARKLGVDYDTLKAEHADIVYCHVSSYGPLGERADWPGFDQLFQAACGWEVENGGAGNPPLWLRFGIVDFYGGLASVFATLLARVEHGRSGAGQAVAASLLGGAMLTMAEAIIPANGGLTPIAHLDHAQMGVLRHHRLYATGTDWIAVAALADRERAAFDVVVGADAGAWLAGRDADAALSQLAEAGVPAERVARAQHDAFLDSADHAAAGLHADYPHREYGHVRQIGGFWDFDDLPLHLGLASPALGEHTAETLAMVGIDAAARAALSAQGLIHQA
ncbi:CoA transferase [Sphingomonas sp. A2-49]|uniref:CoA transferase n=1 Tax=Sphingomonas sp. A2-49 TaxID=1391375 RepID=UPI0021D178CF|nr:CoA transferase [Sphingomonas sp. A2-49]MCU6453145.1 CoA transferase [Sphingomonas sp. A2-49]